FDALTSKRPYKEPYPVDSSLRAMRAEVGSHFDPEIFDLFVQNTRTIYENIANFSENQLESRLHTIMQDYFGPSEKIGEKR
ncbi:MAG: hypothetical protein OEL57_06875, partial [Trichlorobacter sp.]|nr:hypothetical protein [Trichlorobacter sp.]